MLTRRSRRKSRSYILFDESRMLRNERALFQTWLFKTPRYFLKTFSFLPGFTIAQTKSQFNPKIVTSPKFCIFPKFIYLFLYILDKIGYNFKKEDKLFFVANIPYYITTPIITKFIDEKILRNYGVSLPILTGDYTKEQYEAFYQKALEPLINTTSFRNSSINSEASNSSVVWKKYFSISKRDEAERISSPTPIILWTPRLCTNSATWR